MKNKELLSRIEKLENLTELLKVNIKAHAKRFNRVDEIAKNNATQLSEELDQIAKSFLYILDKIQNTCIHTTIISNEEGKHYCEDCMKEFSKNDLIKILG